MFVGEPIGQRPARLPVDTIDKGIPASLLVRDQERDERIGPTERTIDAHLGHIPGRCDNLFVVNAHVEAEQRGAALRCDHSITARPVFAGSAARSTPAVIMFPVFQVRGEVAGEATRKRTGPVRVTPRSI